VDRKLTLLSASAGFGKTTLMAEWCQQADQPITWLSLDKKDNDPVRFFNYMIAALQKIDAEICQAAQVEMQNPQPLNLEPLLVNIINEVSEKLESFTLILDDYHVIEAPKIHQALTFLLDHAPAQMHITILTRSDPPLPLARLRGRGELTEIHTTDLRFRSDEIGKYLTKVMGILLSDDQVASLEKRTEGWIVGLQLAVLSMKGREDLTQFIRSFTGSQKYILDYLTEEVLQQQSAEIQTFLLKTSILQRLSGSLCDAVTGRTGNQGIIEWLEANNLFVVPLDEERKWYRYHHLFAEVLQNLLRASDPDLFKKLHQRAAAWFEKQGLFEYAIRHAAAGSLLETAAELFEANAIFMLRRGELFTLLNLIELLEDLLDERPWLSIYKSWSLALLGQLDQADRWRQKAEAIIDANISKPSRHILGHIAAIKFYCNTYLGKTDAGFAYAQKALEYLPENEQVVRSIVISMIGSFLRFTGGNIQAVETLEATRRTAREAGNHYLELYVLTTLSAVAYYQGKLHQSCKFAQEALQLSKLPNGQMLPSASWALKGLGYVCYEWNDLEAAENYTQLAIDLGPKWGDPIDMFHTFLLMSHIKIAKKDLAGAQLAFEKGEEFIQSHTVLPVLFNYVKGEKAGYWFMLGNLEAVIQWAQESGISATDQISLYRMNHYRTLARVYLESEQYEAALELLMRLQNQVEAIGRTRSFIQTLVLRALAHQSMNDIPQAMSVLEHAITLTKSEGYKRMFVDEGKPMERLLSLFLDRGISKSYVSELLAAFRETDIVSIPNAHLVDPLSDRELEVLCLIADGLSNREIAEKLVVAVSTIKTHVNHIYRKLDVNNRTQAVVKSHQLGLL
jgi:LuxR family maltose regulon positive regulatory protein